MSPQNRINAGIPTGGQFASHDRAESVTMLDGVSRNHVVVADVDLDLAYPVEIAGRRSIVGYIPGTDIEAVIAPIRTDPASGDVAARILAGEVSNLGWEWERAGFGEDGQDEYVRAARVVRDAERVLLEAGYDILPNGRPATGVDGAIGAFATRAPDNATVITYIFDGAGDARPDPTGVDHAALVNRERSYGTKGEIRIAALVIAGDSTAELQVA